MARLTELKNEEVEWRAPWMYCQDMLYRCGDYHCVPLLGLWGSTNYIPLMFRRQVGCGQFIPATHDLQDPLFTFSYEMDGALGRMEQLNQAWQRRFVVEKSPMADKVASEYLEWQKNRGKNVNAPEEVTMAPPSLGEIKRKLEVSEIAREILAQEKEEWVNEKKRKIQEIDDLTGKKEDLGIELSREQRRHSETQRKVEEAKGANERYKEEIKEVEKNVKKVERSWEDLKIEFTLVTTERNESWNENKKRKKENEQLRTENEQLKRQLEKLKADLEREQKGREQLGSEKKECLNKIIQLEAEKRTLHDKHLQLDIEQSL